MSNAFDAVTLSVSKIIHRVYAPFVASAVMLCIFDAIHQRVAQMHIRTGHIDFGTQHLFSFGKRSEEHTSELQSLMRLSYAVFCLKQKIKCTIINYQILTNLF